MRIFAWGNRLQFIHIFELCVLTANRERVQQTIPYLLLVQEKCSNIIIIYLNHVVLYVGTFHDCGHFLFARNIYAMRCSIHVCGVYGLVVVTKIAIVFFCFVFVLVWQFWNWNGERGGRRGCSEKWINLVSRSMIINKVCFLIHYWWWKEKLINIVSPTRCHSFDIVDGYVVD